MKRTNYKKKQFKKTKRDADNMVNRALNHEDLRFSKDNDASWYTLNNQLVSDTANFSFDYPIGRPLDLGDFGSKLNGSSVPGVMAIYTAPTYGGTSWFDQGQGSSDGYLDQSSSINIAARQIYTFIRSNNSGAKNYDPTDLMIHLLAMDQLYSLIAWMKRLYGMSYVVNTRNSYYPQALIEANLVNYQEITKNRNVLRSIINFACSEANRFPIPAGMPYMARHQWMYENVFLDANSPKAQTYMYVPMFFNRLALDSTGAGCLVKGCPELKRALYDRSKLITTDDLYNMVGELIAPINSQGNGANMSGDIIKAFGNNLYTITGVEENYAIIPSYSEEVLSQIENATLIGEPIGLQESNYEETAYQEVMLKQKPSTGTAFYGLDSFLDADYTFYNQHVYDDVAAGSNSFGVDKFVNFHKPNPTPEDVMVATRFTNVATKFMDDGRSMKYPTLGSDCACYAQIYQYETVKTGAFTTFTLMPSELIQTAMPYDIGINVSQLKNPSSDMMQLYVDKFQQNNKLTELLSQFDWHPAIYLTTVVRVLDENNKWHVSFGTQNGVLFDLDVYTMVNARDLVRMSHTALQSEFGLANNAGLK